ncbi:hypothetical protein CYME_CMI060C [Cyanidioschyzon merolae strain 10D]|uniref:Uncharacterized protein n=1 Tax=Cyanidioschyzon merolae (strain NIES-3377 / 10D) TaxID=280699 RepID=M1VGU0_CYAM1|nr:hypothetical protein CYME_CMI060C [Cyanidioschyzon merolae strain 10D]BAM79963.1 hypothetical protein CYME_CMI060C [Cyanidioschyzon merolae strain 10D]|eukprot:XP_005536249.1 hypothetical protein CYME_CMI060C [Cyanidioschyzon merolae strain 10D]
MKKHRQTKGKARVCRRTPRVERRMISSVLKSERLLSKGLVVISSDETRFSGNSRPEYGYPQKSRPHILKSAQRAFRQNQSQRRFNLVDGCKSPNGQDSLRSHLSLNHLVVALSLILLFCCQITFQHSTAAAEHAAELGNELLFVSTASPWSNPVEAVFAGVKRHLYANRSTDKSFSTLTSPVVLFISTVLAQAGAERPAPHCGHTHHVESEERHWSIDRHKRASKRRALETPSIQYVRTPREDTSTEYTNQNNTSQPSRGEGEGAGLCNQARSIRATPRVALAELVQGLSFTVTMETDTICICLHWVNHSPEMSKSIHVQMLPVHEDGDLSMSVDSG